MMRTADLVASSGRALRANPMRSALTALGVIIGVASVVAMSINTSSVGAKSSTTSKSAVPPNSVACSDCRGETETEPAGEFPPPFFPPLPLLDLAASAGSASPSEIVAKASSERSSLVPPSSSAM